jgi:hypothetical protein
MPLAAESAANGADRLLLASPKVNRKERAVNLEEGEAKLLTAKNAK